MEAELASMDEYAVLLPHKLHDGTIVEFTPIETILLDTFGGFTAGAPNRGAWRDPKTGRVYVDETTPYTLASDDAEKIIRFAEAMAARLDQETIYVRMPNNAVHFVERRADSVQR